MTKIINEVTPEHLAKLDQIDRDCITMHVPTPPKTFINMKVHDAAGELILDYNMPSRSWNRNAYNVLAGSMMGTNLSMGGGTFGAGKTATKSIFSGVTNSASYTGGWTVPANCIGGANVDNMGIVIGTGTGAESFEGYVIGTLIAQGTSSGQMTYNAQSVGTMSYDSGTKKMSKVDTRVFNNNSGGAITVTEVCWYVDCFYNKLMLCRDLLSSSVAVPNAGQLTVTYTMELTYPA